jgi:hypothetical protein
LEDGLTKKVFFTWLDAYSRISVEFQRDRKDIESFVVKLEVLRGIGWKEVQRFDTFHDCVHKDLIAPNGEKQRSIRYEYLEASAGLTTAIRDYKEHFRSYIRRWEDAGSGDSPERR